MKRSMLVILPLLFAVATSLAAEKRTKVEIVATYQAKVANAKKPELKAMFIAAEGDWKDVWEKLGSKDKLPEVDFKKHILLVTTQDAADPNRRGASVVKDEQGAVTIVEMSTLIGFQPSDQTIYRFHQISREGVTGVKRYDAEKKKHVVEPLPK